jgi:hypothetical protein
VLLTFRYFEYYKANLWWLLPKGDGGLDCSNNQSTNIMSFNYRQDLWLGQVQWWERKPYLLSEFVDLLQTHCHNSTSWNFIREVWLSVFCRDTKPCKEDMITKWTARQVESEQIKYKLLQSVEYWGRGSAVSIDGEASQSCRQALLHVGLYKLCQK